MTHTSSLFVLAVLLASTFAEDSYFLLAPKTIRPGQPLSVFVRILNATGPVQVDVRVLDSENEEIAEVSESINTGIPKVLELQIPADLPSGSYILQAEAAGGGVVFSENKDLQYSAKASSIFIQTDKAVYRPGELVRIKVIGIYSSLQVVHEPIDVIIFDSQNNRIKQWLGYIDPTSRVFKGELQLNEVTNTGDWRVSVQQLNTKEDKIFEVREFVLPRYEVNLQLPSFGVKSDDHFTGKVSATYTFEKPVKGELIVLIERVFQSDHKIELHFKDFDGERDFSVSMDHVTNFLSSFQVRVTAIVIEGLTGDRVNDTSDIRLYDFPEKLTFPEFLPKVYKPGLDYKGVLRLTQQDDSPLPNATEKINITVSYYVQVKPPPNPPTTEEDRIEAIRILPDPFPDQTTRKDLPSILKDVPKNGNLKFDVAIPSDAAPGSNINIVATYGSASAFLYLRSARSPSDTFLQVRLKSKESNLKTGKRAKFGLKATEKMLLVDYQILSKTVLVDYGHVNAGNKTSTTFRVELSQLMAPRATLLVYFVRDDGEVVSDSITINVDGLFKNKASLNFNKKKVKPNTKVKLNLKAAPGSEMHVLAIDKKVLLLKTGNDITQNDIQLYDDFQPTFFPFPFFRFFPIPNDGTDAFSVFQKAGVVLITDLTIYQFLNDKLPLFRFGAVAFATGGTSTKESTISSARLRKRFPDTWIWTDAIAGANGKATLTRRVPDSITTWVASMFASDTKTGLGVASSPAEVTVFLDEFIQINTPRTAIRGEIIVVQVDFFNYGTKDIEVVIILRKTKEFCFADADGNSFTPNNPKFPGAWAKTITVKTNEIGSVFFPIKPLVIGDMDLTVLAKAKKKGKKLKDIDAVKKPIKVKAEGVRQSYSLPSLKILKGDTITETLNITFPEDHVSGSEFIQVSAIGDIMGPSLAGIEDLLQTSYGCGEQNLLNFVPNVFVTKYLAATNRLTPEIKARTEELLEAGYQRELKFKRGDGSFSAFGTRDKSGSTWLTAFVVKAFAQAKNDTYIDPKVMSDAISFLLKQQSKDGSFNEPGIVLHKEMQGGSISSVRSLTLFVLTSLAEAERMDFVSEEISEGFDEAITNAIAFITSGGIESFTNTYELGLAVYTLTLLDRNLNIVDELFAELETRATVEDGKKFWLLSDDEAEAVSPYKSSWRPPVTRSRALDIEVTAYVMLAYVEKTDTINGLQILKWLVTQQNSRGGFVSTQDTVVALQALASLAELVYEDNFSISVNVVSTPGTFSQTFTINNENALVLQIGEIPYVQNVQELTVTATGTGICLLEVSVFFNVEEELRVPAFAMNATLRNDTMEGFKLDICFRWLREGRSTMVLLDVGFPTGTEGDISLIDTSAASTFKNAERNEEDIEMYFDYVTADAMCVTIQVFRTSLVANAKEAAVTVSDYYETANSETVFYKSETLSGASPEDVCLDLDCF
ncbi:CD109 antigen-like [Argopecten irradians]|uniref:CD109 antigen-like n=1 Tax=Argopecten irradians TaxID=31199 RepID=UPI003724849D